MAFWGGYGRTDLLVQSGPRDLFALGLDERRRRLLAKALIALEGQKWTTGSELAARETRCTHP